ncbi:hypothetical protein M0811_06687 [Anaeramoeba ignava]|uniref:Uncharacterized protein n=1 Tax=Anaeramoeba ignava TaxID=1746090 RepID=A0A9Q0LQ29_ANAIG|nr:hypothetical protein M0811_06687 [Anaeramoeba ignava]
MKKNLLIIFFFFISFVSCRISNFKIEDDKREGFLLKKFGFDPNGIIKFKINSLTFSRHINPHEQPNIGFIIHKFLENDLENHNMVKCPFENIRKFVIVANESEWRKGFEWKIKINESQEGEYLIWYRNCEDLSVSFDLVLTLYNEGPNYLSVGEFPLPGTYLMFFFFYFVITLFWLIYLRKNKDQKINRVHFLMTALLISKMFCVLFLSIEYFDIQKSGVPNGWNIPYYIFAFFKGVLTFIVIILIGTGWSFLKKSLSLKEKRLFAIVIPLQILDNIALVVITEQNHSSKTFYIWEIIFRLVDIICVCLILFPIIWSINHLKSVANVDKSISRILGKLKLFRLFYILTVSFIYSTRILIIFLEHLLSYKYTWIAPFFDELLTFLFFVTIGYKFRPEKANPLLKITQYGETSDENEDNLEEIDLDDFDLANQSVSIVNKK